MAASLPDNVKQMLDRPNFAHFATLMPDGSPNSTPVWIGREDERVLVCTSGKSLKARNTRRDPRVAISMVDFDNPYHEIQLRGRVVEHRPDTGLKSLDALSVRYTGKPFPIRDHEDPVTLVIEIENTRHLKLPFEYVPPRKRTGQGESVA